MILSDNNIIIKNQALRIKLPDEFLKSRDFFKEKSKKFKRIKVKATGKK